VTHAAWSQSDHTPRLSTTDGFASGQNDTGNTTVLSAVVEIRVLACGGKVARSKLPIRWSALWIGWSLIVVALTVMYWSGMWPYRDQSFREGYKIFWLAIPTFFLVVLNYLLSPASGRAGSRDRPVEAARAISSARGTGGDPMKLIDLTRRLDAADLGRIPKAARPASSVLVPEIEYVEPAGKGAEIMCALFGCTRDDLPDGEGWGEEQLRVSSHRSTRSARGGCARSPWSSSNHVRLMRGGRTRTLLSWLPLTGVGILPVVRSPARGPMTTSRLVEIRRSAR